MREVTPIERALSVIQRQRRELDLLTAELEALLPDDDHQPQKNVIEAA